MNMKEAMKAKGVSTSVLAERVGVSQSAISKISTGSSRASMELARKIASELEIDVRLVCRSRSRRKQRIYKKQASEASTGLPVVKQTTKKEGRISCLINSFFKALSRLWK